jgi:hypothetical protein
MAPEHYLILADVCDNSLEMWIGRDLHCDTANGEYRTTRVAA